MEIDEFLGSNRNAFNPPCEPALKNSNLTELKKNCKNLLPLIDVIDNFAETYDFDKEVQANGYRSFVETCRAHMSKADELCQNAQSKWYLFWFSKQKFVK